MCESDEVEIPPYIQNHIDRLSQNLSRVDNLISVHEALEMMMEKHLEQFKKEDVEKALKDVKEEEVERTLHDLDDILRSAIVLLHASLEDCLRTIALEHLSRADPDLLKDIPLAGVGNLRKTRFGLGDLVPHRRKTIADVIESSLDQWLHHSSFNNTTDLAAMLNRIGIDPETCNASFSSLDEMTSRRHRIVHNADRASDADGSGNPGTTPITRDTVAQWRGAVEAFIVAAVCHLPEVVEGD